MLQQSLIMRKHGAKIELWDNIKELVGLKKKDAPGEKSKAAAVIPPPQGEG